MTAFNNVHGLFNYISRIQVVQSTNRVNVILIFDPAAIIMDILHACQMILDHTELNTVGSSSSYLSSVVDSHLGDCDWMPDRDTIKYREKYV
jgi:hypothetical protein